MRFLFVYPFCGLGGVETSIVNKLDAFGAEGIEGRALLGTVYGSAGNLLARDPRVATGLDDPEVAALVRSSDVVSVVDFPDFVEKLEELRFPGTVLFETHASAPSARTRLYRHLDHPRVRAIVVPSAFNRGLVEPYVTAARPVVVIPNPLDPHRFGRPDPRAVPTVSLPPGGPILLWIGRLEDEKNPLEFVRIGERVLGSRPDVRLLMIGDAFDTEEYLGYVERVRGSLSPQAARRLTLLRSVPYPEMADLYSRVGQTGGVLVSTSLHESAPMTFIEAMACSCPVVSSDVGGVRELLGDGESGRSYALGDVAGAADAIRELTDPGGADRRRALVRRAQAFVAERHAPKAIAARYRSLVEGIRVGAPSSDRTPLRQPRKAIEARAEGGLVPRLVTTIIPVYNRPGLLREAVGSVLDQTYPHVEIIIVDDGSTDETAAVCDELAREHPVVTVLHRPHGGRAGLAREAGRVVARGEYIQYLDSDDLLMPTKFAVMVAALEADPDCDIAYCFTRRYPLGSTPVDVPAARTGETFTAMFPEFVSHRFWLTSTPLYRRRLCDRIGPWSDLEVWEDIEYDVRAATHHPRLRHVKEWLTDMRDHDLGRLSRSAFASERVLREVVRASALIYEHVKGAGLGYDNEHVRSFVDDVRFLYQRAVELNLDAEAETCAAIVMEAAGARTAADVGKFRLGAVLEPQLPALRLPPAKAEVCSVVVRNTSDVAFHGGDCSTQLSYHLLEADGSILRFENSSCFVFDEPLGPGESRAVDLWVRAPNVSGLYYVELDVLWGGSVWLSSIGNPRTFLKLLVGTHAPSPAWRLQVAPGNGASLEHPPGSEETIRVAIREASTETPWHIQLNHENVAVVANRRYVVRGEGRADRHRRLAVAVSRAHDPWTSLGLYREVELTPEWQPFRLEFVAEATDDRARVHFDLGGDDASVEVQGVVLHAADGAPVVAPPFSSPGRLRMDIGTDPLSDRWGTDRGLPVHRYYLEQFLDEFAADVRGRVLEFQDPQYAPRFGRDAVTRLDILHVDGSNPRATLVADLTKRNELPSEAFDCVVCTHVLHLILDVERAAGELFRILRPGGVLLVAVPHVSMCDPDCGEIWRFTPFGLESLLARAFGRENLEVRSYGNSLIAAGEIRGVVADEFLPSELERHDARFAVEVCARAVKRVRS